MTGGMRKQSDDELGRREQIAKPAESAAGEDATVQSGNIQRESGAKTGGLRPIDTAREAEPSKRRGSKRTGRDEVIDLTVEAGALGRACECDGSLGDFSVGPAVTAIETQQLSGAGTGRDNHRAQSKRNKTASSTTGNRTRAESMPPLQRSAKRWVQTALRNTGHGVIVTVLATPEGDDTGHKAPMQTCGAKSDRVQGQEQTEDPIQIGRAHV